MEKMTKTLLLNMCMIIDEQNHRVVVEDRIDDDWKGITFPGGHVENNESMIDSTIREVKEETGLHVKNLIPCGLIDWYNTDNQERWFIFLYKTSHYEGTMLEGTEEGKVFWMDIEDLPNANLAPNMDTYLKLFFNDSCNEAYATWNSISPSKFRLQ